MQKQLKSKKLVYLQNLYTNYIKEAENLGYGVSLFEKLAKSGHKNICTLETQYRNIFPHLLQNEMYLIKSLVKFLEKGA